ncbi:MAG: L-rhamnose isomerase [Anaerolineae bacterium]|nr:L-rhamnose isomerase [Anaerolineae bacterium]
MHHWQKAYEVLAEQLVTQGVDVESVKAALKAQRIETPSWGYGDSGTRFKVFAQAGAARTPFEKVADAAQVHRFTGVCPTVALHIPWDMVDDFGELKSYAENLGMRLGAINPNLFQEDEYKLGSLAHPDEAVRQKAVEHVLECTRIAQEVESGIISLWLADGTNYPGQDSIRGRKRRLEASLVEIYQSLPARQRLLIEYKFYEPAFYLTDIPDWGTAYALSLRLGQRAQVLVDLGHHPLGTNVEQIVAFLLDEGKLGGFHFNARKYGDDDLTTGSINPYELFLIYSELVDAERDPAVDMDVAYMIDQSHNVKPKIEAMIQSVVQIQEAYAKALLVDREALAEHQQAGNIVAAEETLRAAYDTDVRPLLAQVRVEMGLEPDPLAAYRASGYQERIAKERGTAGGGSGYQGA